MQPENDTQQVRRVLARAGITAAALTLSLGAAAPAAFAHGGQGDAHSQAGDHGSQGDAHSQAGDHGSQGDAHSQAGEHGASSGSAGGTDSGHNPPGNNGTVKIHDVAGDMSHHNVPHVDCDFWVPMWGFDAGQNMTVSFAGQAPTGKDDPVTFTALDGTTLTSPDDAGGGNDYDGELGFTTTPESLQSQLGAPAHQGYHVKMTVATGAPGGYKYKVFWINCQSAPTGGGSGGGGDTGGGGGGNTGGGGGGNTGGGGGGNTGGTTGGGTSSGGTVAGETAHQSSPGSAVLGEKVTRGTTGATAVGATVAPGASSLPFTGAEIGGLAAAGAAALGGGGFLMMAGRRRRRAGAHRA